MFGFELHSFGTREEILKCLVVFVLHRWDYERCCIGSNGAGGSSGGTRIRTVRRCVCCSQHLRWTFESSCHIWIGYRRQHHPPNRFLLLDCSIDWFYPCMSPPQPGYRQGTHYSFFQNTMILFSHILILFWLLSHNTEHSNPWTGLWCERFPRCGVWDYYHFCVGLHGVRNCSWP